MTSLTGHIRNEKATQRARADGPPPGDLIRTPTNFDELDDALAEMRDASVGRLIINGGDGTVREVLSRAPEIWAARPNAPLPDYVVAPSGNTNLIARKVGGATGRDLRLIWQAEEAALRRRPLRLLTVERTGKRILRGAIMGVGAYEVATRVARQDISARHGAQVALAVMRLLVSDEMRDGLMCRVAHDGVAAGLRQRMLFGMTTLPGKLISRFEPFWGPQTGPIRWLDIDAQPKHLIRAAPFVAAGAPRPWMSDHYHSGTSTTVSLEIAAPFVMDGEAFEPGTDGRVTVTAHETATFLTLP